MNKSSMIPVVDSDVEELRKMQNWLKHNGTPDALYVVAPSSYPNPGYIYHRDQALDMIIWVLETLGIDP